MTRTLDLALTGMTCASCARRIERRLSRLDGVTATVNYATETATVQAPDEVTDDALVAAVEAAGYGATVPASPGETTGGAADEERRGDADLRALRTRVLVSAALGLPVLALSMVPAWQFESWQWLALTLASPVVVWGGAPFHRAAWTTLRHGSATMDTLVSGGTLAAWLWSLYALFLGSAGEPGMTMSFDLTLQRTSGDGEIYLEVAAVVTVFLLAGRYLEARAKRRAGAALTALLELGAKDVTLLRDGVETRVPVGKLVPGDVFVVKPGEKVATDGVVVEGRSHLDTSLLTGESLPVDAGPGDSVTGATVVLDGRLLVRAERVGSDTWLAQVGRLVTQAQNGKAEVQRLADAVSGVFVPVVLLVAAATLGYWLGTGTDAATAVAHAVAVLVVACPCALGLATPTALLVGTGRGAQLGLLIKGPEVLESTRRVDTVVLDKTGTLTTGRMTLHEVHGSGEVLRLAAAVEQGSEHPVAAAVVAAALAAAPASGAGVPAAQGFRSVRGRGVSADVAGRRVWVGRPSWLREEGLAVPAGVTTAMDGAEGRGRTAVAVGWDGAAQGVLEVGDSLKPSAAAAVAALRALGLRPVLLTGDNARAAAAVAAEVGIEEVVAGVLPEEKAAHVQRLQEQGRTVAMVGDGVNDAAALAQADLGLAMATGTDVAIEASDLTVVREDLRAVADGIRLARRTLRTIKGNLFWAFAYNVAAIPVAVSGLLNPLVAGAAMALSSLFVVSNSLRLRAFRPLPTG